MPIKNNLERLYKEIHECQRCHEDSRSPMESDKSRVMRKVSEQDIRTRVFIIGQALGGKTQRISGRPYTYPNGDISQTGKTLEGFLNQFGYTVQEDETSFRMAYSSDLVQCFPGYSSEGGDRKPNTYEIANCWEWLIKELDLMRPDVIILLGGPAGKWVVRRLEVSGGIKQGGRVEVERWGKRVSIFSVYHPSYRRRATEAVDRQYGKIAADIAQALTSIPGEK
jgi:uracil-DNA glycosylase family 4